jgi:hypothetical protein
MAVNHFSPKRPIRKGKRKRWRFLWDEHRNQYSYPMHRVWYTFNWGRFAALLVIILMVLFIGYVILDLWILT